MFREPFQRCGAVCVLWLCIAAPAVGAGPNEAAIAAGREPATHEMAAQNAADPVAGARDTFGRNADRLVFPSLTRSGPDATGARPSQTDESWILTTCMALAAVVALIFIIRLLMVRFTGRAAAPSQSPLLEVLSRVSVAPRSNILIIRLGQRVIAVADGASGMRTLADIDDPDEVAQMLRVSSTIAPRSATTAFRTLLHRFHGGYGRSERLNEEGGDEHEYRVDRARDQVSGLVSRIRRLGGGGGQ